MHDHVSSSRRPRPDDVIEKLVEDVETTVRDAGLPHGRTRLLELYILWSRWVARMGVTTGSRSRQMAQSGGRSLVRKT